MLSRFKAAAVHAAPVFLDKQATTKKAISLIREAAAAGAEIVAFSETFIPAFPVWAALWAPIDNHDLFVRMADQSVPVDGPEVKAIRDEARALGIMVSIGISEKSPASVGAIWNSNLLIGEDGEILNHHRKLVPTFYEKLIWSGGDGAGLRVVDTRLGRIGQLICGENTNPLARYALMARASSCTFRAGRRCGRPAVRLTVSTTTSPPRPAFVPVPIASRPRSSASSPPACSTRRPGTCWWHAIRRRQRCWNSTPRAELFFLDPSGEQIGDALRDDEGILYAEIDLNRCVEPKQFHDVVGYYNRFDVFDLSVNRRRLSPATFTNDAAAPPEASEPPVREEAARPYATARIGF